MRLFYIVVFLLYVPPFCLQLYTGYIGKLEEVLTDLEATLRKNKKFESFYRDFEIQKVCYLPFNTFLLKPVQRLLHYKLVLESKQQQQQTKLNLQMEYVWKETNVRENR